MRINFDINNNNLLLGGFVLLGIGAIGITNFKAQKKTVAQGVRQILESDKIDISQELINRAVNEKVQQTVNEAVKGVSNDILNRVKGDITADVNAELGKHRGDLIQDISNKVAESVERVNKDDIAKEIRSKTKDILFRKLEREIDDSIDKDDVIRVLRIMY